MKLIKKIKKLNNEASLGLMILMVVVIFVMLNFFSYQIFYSFDLTKNKDYSLSAVTKSTVGSLDDVVTIKAYFSKELPSQYLNLNQEVADILDGYQNYSKGKVRVQFIDPKDNKELQQELLQKGIPELQFNIMEKDKYQVVNGYLGLLIQYADKNEVVPVVENTSNLEYTITSNIKKITAKTIPILGYVSSNGTLDPETEISKAYESLTELYEIQPIDLENNKIINPTISTLIISGPKEKFSDEELKTIDEFVMRGGTLLLMADGVKVESNLVASNNDLGLNKLLNGYGLKLNNDLVLDNSSGIASFNQGYMTFNINYPFWPKILKSGFDQQDISTAKLESLTLPWASSVEQIKTMDNSLNVFSFLLSSSKKSWLVKEKFDLNPQQDYENQQMSKSNMAISVKGKFKSPFTNKSVEDNRIIIVGDSDFLRDNFLAMGDNLAFFQNMVDSLSLDEDLISIRSKGITNHPLTLELTQNKKMLLRYLNVFGLTILSVGFGLYRYSSRRKKRQHKANI